MAISGKARTVLLCVSIFVLVMAALLLIRDRRPNAIASMRPTGLAAASHPAVTRHADIPPSRADGAGTVEVCGYGRVPIDKSDPGAIFQRVGALTKEAGTRWLSALQNSGDL